MAVGMVRTSAFAALLFVDLLLPALTTAAEIDFGALSLVGSARREGPSLRLTPSQDYLAGAAWVREKQPVTNGFESNFQFKLTEQGGVGHGADGLAFVLQNSGPSALGALGGGGGFALGADSGIPQSIAIFFDTFRNPEMGDLSNNFVTICTAGTPKEMRWPPPRLASTKRLRVNLKDGKMHTARISYQPPVLAVYLDNTRVLASTVDLSTVIGSDGEAWIGFTASTGAGYENHDILSWSFSRPDSGVVSSTLSFAKAACLPGRNLCTPERAVIDESGSGIFHIVLPGNSEWGASIPNPEGRVVVIANANGNVCQGIECSGPAALIQRTSEGRTWFSVKAPSPVNEGYFEFEARIQ